MSKNESLPTTNIVVIWENKISKIDKKEVESGEKLKMTVMKNINFKS